MTFTQAVSSVLGKYATFQGRAPRSEYWWWTLFCVLVPIAIGVVEAVLFPEFFWIEFAAMPMDDPRVDVLTSLFNLFTLIPSIAVSVRRFHDMGRTGWWLLLIFTGIGAFIIIIWFMFKGTAGPNRFGPDPLEQ